MRVLLSLGLLLAALFILPGCTEQEEAVKQEPVSVPAPHFTRAETPQEVLASYFEDLERYLPDELLNELDGPTDLTRAADLIRRYHTLALVKWYYDPGFLKRVDAYVARKVAKMDYQLNILEVPAADATPVILLTDAGPLEHRKALENGAIKQQWEQKDDNSYRVLLSQGEWAQPIYLVRADGIWRLAVPDL
jgi:hypothetical protein